MAPSTSLSVLPTTHTNPHRFDCFLPKPSSLFGPHTSSQLVKSSSILDSPDERTFRYSIEALLAINRDSGTMTERTRVLAAQKAEHRRNLANHANQRAARKEQSQKEGVHASTARASTPPLNVSRQDMRFRLHRVATSTSISFASQAYVTSDSDSFLLPCDSRYSYARVVSSPDTSCVKHCLATSFIYFIYLSHLASHLLPWIITLLKIDSC